MSSSADKCVATRCWASLPAFCLAWSAWRPASAIIIGRVRSGALGTRCVRCRRMMGNLTSSGGVRRRGEWSAGAPHGNSGLVDALRSHFAEFGSIKQGPRRGRQGHRGRHQASGHGRGQGKRHSAGCYGRRPVDHRRSAAVQIRIHRRWSTALRAP